MWSAWKVLGKLLMTESASNLCVCMCVLCNILTDCLSITCVCDPQGTIFNCFPTNYKLRNDISDSGQSSNIQKSHMEQDEKVEIILASTALVAVVALFLRWIIRTTSQILGKNSNLFFYFDDFPNFLIVFWGDVKGTCSYYRNYWGLSALSFKPKFLD